MEGALGVGRVPCGEEGEHSSTGGEKREEGTLPNLCRRRKWIDLVDQGCSGSDGSAVGDVEARGKPEYLCFTMRHETSLLFAMKLAARSAPALDIEALRSTDLGSSRWDEGVSWRRVASTASCACGS